MGMYDYIICRYPLPGEPPGFCANAGHQYQTKSLDCLLHTYEITQAGQLKRIESGVWEKLHEPEMISFDGVLEFYDGNLSAAAYGLGFTQNGEDEEWVTYEATFVNGVVQRIIETERERKPALARYLLEEIDAKFDKDQPEVTMTEPEIGQRLYLQRSGWVTLLSKTLREWAAADETGRIHKLHPNGLGRRLFHSQEESDRVKTWREKTQELKRVYAKELLLARANKKPRE